MIEMLRSVDMPAERRQRALDLMGRASSHITDLVNDVLDLARIEAGSFPIRRQDVELAPLLEDVCDLLAPLAEERDVRLTTSDTSARVRADARRLRQVLINLGSNAVIHNLPGQSAEIFAVEGDSTVTITIEDSGPGIALDRLERIFLPFERLDADQRDAPGSGLGMALALALTRAMGGDLTVMSTPAHGTTVRVMLPRSAGDAGES